MKKLILIGYTSTVNSVVCPNTNCNVTHNINKDFINETVECCNCGKEFKIKYRFIRR